MSHKAYISFKTEDLWYKQAVQSLPDLDYIDKSLNESIASQDDDYIMSVIRADYLYDSTVTIFLIGEHSSESRGAYEQRYIKRELQASLYQSSVHGKNGILGVVLPNMVQSVFGGSYQCSTCGRNHRKVVVDDSTVIREFSYNYYIPNDKCSHSEDDRYCVLTTWDEFVEMPTLFVDTAFEKRSSEIASKTRVRP